MGGNLTLPAGLNPIDRSFNHKPFSPVYERIYREVRRIPRGKVATYGQVAKIVGRCTARMVGYAMAALRGRTDVPWQRVVNSRGEVSPRAHGDGSIRQRNLLRKERIRFDPRGRIDLRKFQWAPGPASSSPDSVLHSSSPSLIL